MALPSSGQISLNQMHVEAGGTTGTQASMNDSDIRGLVSAAANSQMTFSSFYGASSGWSTTGTANVTSSKFGVGSFYERTGNLTYGSIVDSTVDILNGAIVYHVGESAFSNIHTIYFGVYTKADPFTSPTGTNSPYIWSGGNSGWSTLNFAGITLSRTAASSFAVFNAGLNREQVNWVWNQTGTFPVTGLTVSNNAFAVSLS